MIKPDGVSRRLEDDIFERIEKAGLKVLRKRELRVSAAEAADLYSPHLGKHFYSGLIKFITSGPVVASLIEGDNAIARVREAMGETDPRAAAAGTIRGDFKEENVLNVDGILKNLVHGSDSAGSAKREMAIFFKEEQA